MMIRVTRHPCAAPPATIGRANLDDLRSPVLASEREAAAAVGRPRYGQHPAAEEHLAHDGAGRDVDDGDRRVARADREQAVVARERDREHPAAARDLA